MPIRSWADYIMSIQLHPSARDRIFADHTGGAFTTDVERRRLARKAQALGRMVLNELETLVTPDTLLRWYRELVAFK